MSRLVLHLGVIDTPHLKSQSTADIAAHLEKKYKVMRHFYEKYESAIAENIADAMMDAIENGTKFKPNKIGSISRDFATFLNTREIEGMGIRGVPTKRALMGWRSRMKNPRKAKKGGVLVARPSRPSFVDTGIYLRSFVAWVEAK